MSDPNKTQHNTLPVKGFFPLPNVIFDLGLTAEEIAIYAFLMCCEDRRTFTCYPGIKTIGRAIGKSKNTVLKYIRSLEEKGLITTRRTFVVTRNGARNGTLLFSIAPIQSAIEVFYYQQLLDTRDAPHRNARKRG